MHAQNVTLLRRWFSECGITLDLALNDVTIGHARTFASRLDTNALRSASFGPVISAASMPVTSSQGPPRGGEIGWIHFGP
ncbi:hypothetical protein G352_01112 [Rhodococcus ruber BKS 20-38]|uniref:Uncharacterized protein n=1 Tax=Rhodococcus ruber BKS 20-38 TaxID=1278076 RepID=M2ZIZ3_9NOCA|nr:hypothetical protein [Rhodococcus ruber]EME67267.1 hypothetical protein G352_01112 [Rhodococcus ruber BKS 20-38]